MIYEDNRSAIFMSNCNKYTPKQYTLIQQFAFVDKAEQVLIILENIEISDNVAYAMTKVLQKATKTWHLQ
jgi:hypothetical protein